MTDASLPDRVEAAARAMFTQRMPLGKKWDDVTNAVRDGYCVMASDVLADACEAERTAEERYRAALEAVVTSRSHASAIACADSALRNTRATGQAERNPNTAEDEPIAAWVSSGGAALGYDSQDEARMRKLGWEPVFRRRPVSSEDVHREAAE